MLLLPLRLLLVLDRGSKAMRLRLRGIVTPGASAAGRAAASSPPAAGAAFPNGRRNGQRPMASHPRSGCGWAGRACVERGGLCDGGWRLLG